MHKLTPEKHRRLTEILTSALALPGLAFVIECSTSATPPWAIDITFAVLMATFVAGQISGATEE